MVDGPDDARLRELEARLEELRRNRPAHSVPPWYVAQVEELEEEIEGLRHRR